MRRRDFIREIVCSAAAWPLAARAGFHADIVVFDPDDFADRATYSNLRQYPSGARTSVIGNGVLVIGNASHTAALSGRLIRRDKIGVVQ